MAELPEDNEENEKKLIELITSREAILFVGAGISKIIGYPIWNELIEILERNAQEKIRFSSETFDFRKDNLTEDNLNYASRLKKFLGKERYSSLIHQTFDDKECDEAHLRLLELPFKAILTTNYDQTLEIALSKIFKSHDNSLVIDNSFSNREILKFFQSLNYGFDGIKKIVHLHGIFKQIDTIVLCQEDYIKKYSSDDPNSDSWTLHKRIIWALMATRRLVYIGFSLNDPFFEMMHSIVSKEIGSFNSETHYMISRFSVDDPKLEQTPNQKSFADKIKYNYGIQTVFFEDDQSYQGIKKYILELGKMLEKDSNAELLPEKTKNASGNAGEGDRRNNEILKINAIKKIGELKGR